MIYASFDLDGILLDSAPLIYDELARQGYIVDGDRRKDFWFKFKKGTAPPEDFLWDIFFYRLFTERWEELKPVDEYVVEFIQLIGEDSPIHIITARPAGAFMHHCTMLSLKKNFPGVDFSIDVVGSGSEKHRWMFGTDIIFEDRRKTVLDMASKNYIVFMRKTDYNHLDECGNIRHISRLHHLRGEIKTGDIITFDDYSQLTGKYVADFFVD